MSRNPVTWFEIMGRDALALQQFYRDVFGWKLTPPTGPEMGYYSMLGRDVDGIAGGIGQEQGGDRRVSVYIEVDDTDAFLKKVEQAGGSTMLPTMTVTEGTTIAIFRDPAGNAIGLLKANPRPAATATRKKTTARKKTAARRGASARKKTAARKKTTTRRTRRAR